MMISIREGTYCGVVFTKIGRGIKKEPVCFLINGRITRGGGGI